MHSTHLGPAAGGTRFWHYADDADALTDALRLSRGMSYKNAMAGLPLGGGKAVVLADKDAPRRPRCSPRSARRSNRSAAAMSLPRTSACRVADMIEISKQTKFVAGLPVAGGAVGGDPGPHTSLGVFLGIKAAVKRALGKDSLTGLHIALAGRRQRRRRRRPPCRGRRRAGCRSPTSMPDRAQKLAAETGGTVVTPDEILTSKPTWSAPARWARSSTEQTIAALNAPIVAGGANNQLATPERRPARSTARGILYAPDYVINAGGIINVSTEYLRRRRTRAWCARGSRRFPGRLEQIWAESAAPAGIPPRSPTPWRRS